MPPHSSSSRRARQEQGGRHHRWTIAYDWPADSLRAFAPHDVSRPSVIAYFALLVLQRLECLPLAWTITRPNRTRSGISCALRGDLPGGGALWCRTRRDNAGAANGNKEHPPPAWLSTAARRERRPARAHEAHHLLKIFAQLQFVEVAHLVRRDRAFKVKFAGEGADDYGGPCHEEYPTMSASCRTRARSPFSS